MNPEWLKLIEFNSDLLIRFAICVGVGFLIGLERQFTKEVKDQEEQFAGVRTFTLVAIFGFLAAFMAVQFGTWLFGVSFVCMIALVIASYIRLSETPGNAGGTSEITTIITFLLGGMIFINVILFSLIIMVLIMLMLAFKPSLHGFVKKLNKEELLAIIVFVVMSALVIPFLPDDNFGPYDLWNLKDIWKMVVLVSGTSLVGYMIAKVMGNKGTIIAGIIGGLVSSTSVSLAFSRRSNTGKSTSAHVFLAIGILGACTVMFPRILFEVYVVNKELVKQLWIPITLLVITGVTAAYLIFRFSAKSKSTSEAVPLKNPLDLSTAIKFALFYAGIQWLVKYCSETFGDRGTYLAGALSGITDVDAITLSMAKMGTGENADLAINTILLAALSNTLVKFIIVMTVGSAQLRKHAIIGFGSIFLVGLGFFCYRLFIN